MAMQNGQAQTAFAAPAFQCLAQLGVFASEKLFVETAYGAKRIGAAKQKTSRRHFENAHDRVAEQHQQARGETHFAKVQRAASTDNLFVFHCGQRVGQSLSGQKCIRVQKQQPIAGRNVRAGIPRAGDVVHRLEHNANARLAREFGGGIRGVVVHHDHFGRELIGAIGGERREETSQAAFDARGFVERWNDNRKLHGRPDATMPQTAEKSVEAGRIKCFCLGMNILEATAGFERWLAGHTPLLPQDLRLKHTAMRDNLFSFLRATYYRWAQVWPVACADCANDPAALAVGDLHVENFGTWRDADARLVWGINDFDECHPLPFSHDLVRLATSARLALEDGELEIAPKAACAAILDGYRDSLRAGGKPFVLADKNSPLRAMARERLETPEKFWEKMHGFPPEKGGVPAKVCGLLRAVLPDKSIKLKFVHRIAGLGSLGKERFTGIGTWLGGQIVREAKALTPSACLWVEGGSKSGPLGQRALPILYERILRTSVRCLDPMVVVRGQWLLRRLSPDCFRIRLSHLPQERNERDLLYSMGWETANVHLGGGAGSKILKRLQKRPAYWLHHAAQIMHDQTLRDWRDWRRR